MAQHEVDRKEDGDESNSISSLTRRAASGTLKVGLLNLEPTTDLGEWKFLVDTSPVTVPFEKVAEDVDWNHLFPKWIDEESRYGTPRCPVFPMPKIPVIPYVSSAVELDVVIARAPCANTNSTLQESWRHPAFLQVFIASYFTSLQNCSEMVLQLFHLILGFSLIIHTWGIR